MCHGHKINNCMHLRKEIETSIKSGKLSHLVKEIGVVSPKGKEIVREEEEEAEKRRSYVDMIRRYPNDEYMDKKRDWEAQESPLNKAVDIVGHWVAHIHVDHGSGSVVMYEHCFRSTRQDGNSSKRKCNILTCWVRTRHSEMNDIHHPRKTRPGRRKGGIRSWIKGNVQGEKGVQCNSTTEERKNQGKSKNSLIFLEARKVERKRGSCREVSV
ncbi:hypothetical protein E3N88_04676 [Mikania micrantha]|uniref:Uncharacterized protein n=1 Tax=Mikania micrantha TaxID=192012 RepID=A0A5N6PX86_9ASTR|nr:hypothetical protein E3N88_04676 [Mikania micrantha]